ncbi:MAG: aminotransferase class I/II-fold pyridoxal phosphate-dependent enzyme, partial [Clostridiales bacterium]|nr:aminotransferase class I/II-fold pyridoxal phosphate-dependent enzyme [Clostridiales bacterium]
WAVSSLAQAGGIAALKEKEYEIRLKELLKKEKAYLSKGLSDAGLKVYGGAANYLFFRSPDEKLHLKLREKGILIRDCSNYKGLCEGYYRTAIRRREENEKLLSAIENALKGR